MVKGNLLIESETFRVGNNEVSLFPNKLRNLSLAVQKCRDNKDTIYGTGDLCFLEVYKYKFYELCAFPLNEIQKEIVDFSHDNQLFLINYLSKFDENNYETCSTFAELEGFFPLHNNGMIGLECNRFECSPEFTVHDSESWHMWKLNFLINNPEKIEWNNVNHPYLPNITYSNILLARESQKRFGGKSYEDFYEFAGKIAGHEKSALAIEVGKIIAESNYYKYDDKISKINNNNGQIRDIYSLEKLGSLIYLSIDIENAAFEVCDHLGQHLGQYPFDGGEPKEIKGDHGIKIE